MELTLLITQGGSSDLFFFLPNEHISPLVITLPCFIAEAILSA